MYRRAFLIGVSVGLAGAITPALSFTNSNASLDLFNDYPASHAIDSRLVTGNDGRTYRILLAIPRQQAPEGGYPILYMLDGNAVFSRLTAAYLSETPGLAIAAIGYDTENIFDVDQRSLDYTPPLLGETGPIADPGRPERQVGGAASFLDRLIGYLREAAEDGVHIDPERRGLWGHSFGGLFSLYALFNRPDAFKTYIPVSPSLWFGDGAIFPFERTAPQASGNRNVFILLGDMESRSNQPELVQPRPSPDTMTMIERLSQRADLSLSSHVLEGAQHGATFAGSFPFALPFAADERG